MIRSLTAATGAMLMRSCIRRLFSYSVLVVAVAAILLSLSGATHARSPKAGKISIFGETVTADPGEDPHLKVDPQVDPVIRDLDGCAVSPPGGNDGAITGGHQETGIMTGAGQTRVKTKLLITLQILFGHLYR
jgi:hypothetical protein